MKRRNWYWDLNIPYKKIAQILSRGDDPRFVRIAGILLSRALDPKYVFELISPSDFCRHYKAIEREITSDEWTKKRAAFWKATYLRLTKELKAKGERFRLPAKPELDFFDRQLIETVKKCRKRVLMSQKELADLMGYSQQYISRIETGWERIGPDFLKKLAKTTNQKIDLDVSIFFDRKGREILTETNKLIAQALLKLDVKTGEFEEKIRNFANKAAYLLNTGRYDYLKKRITKGWTDMEKVAGDTFEIHFAYAFENKQRPLQHEVKLLPNSNSSIDFQYHASLDKVINFELVNIFEREWIRREMDKRHWEIILSSGSQVKRENSCAESIFAQQKIREKVQKEEKCQIIPAKFNIPDRKNVNVIVANVTFVHMGMFDTKDAIEIVLGASYVEPQCRLGMFGLTADLPSDIPETDPYKLKEAYKLNEIFRDRIHFVLFAWDIHKSKRFIDSQYRYFLVPNPKLVQQKTLNWFNTETEEIFK
ncbi:helix-turn-helix domain-containing protein [Patescibacteria group bacterium]|nr:helix-turn-helix domain-containing protein [Patescibacteria group bacterium]